jgi:hypothetical protein
VGTGYVWQMTPKTQVNLQIIRSIQNSTSNLVAGTENETTKQDVHFSNDMVNVSINSRLTEKLTAVMRASLSHVRNEVEKEGDEDVKTRQISSPLSLTLTYWFKRWLQLRLDYSFAYRWGSEKQDRYRLHQITTGVHLQF